MKQYTISFDVLDRSSSTDGSEEEKENGSEYFFDKDLLFKIENKQSLLIDRLTSIVNEVKEK